MQETLTIDRLTQAHGQTVYASDGEKVGSVDEIFYDEQTQQPEWVSLGTGFLGRKTALVPVQGATLEEDGLYVRFSKDQVQGAPDVDMGGGEISQQSEQELYSHYGLDYSERRSDTGLPEGAPGRPGRRGTAGEGDVVRTEEELKVGKRETEAGRARLRKWVETEPVEADVTLERERARVTREPIDQPVSGAEIGEEEVEVSLRKEEPVVEKETVAKERIGLEKDVETERETVGGELRKERVDVEGDVDKKKRR
jgi:Domain of unknown function (DUF2382)/PRC-barrel domain